MYGRVKKIAMCTNNILKEYASAQIASRDTGDTVPYILNQCTRKGGTDVPTKNYYYRFVEDEPTPHRIVAVFDLDFEPVAEYINIKEAVKATGLNRSSVYLQLQNKLPLKERKSPSSGLFFKWKEVL